MEDKVQVLLNSKQILKSIVTLRYKIVSRISVEVKIKE